MVLTRNQKIKETANTTPGSGPAVAFDKNLDNYADTDCSSSTYSNCSSYEEDSFVIKDFEEDYEFENLENHQDLLEAINSLKRRRYFSNENEPENGNNCVYKKFKRIVDSIHDGRFFERVPIEDKTVAELKVEVSEEKIIEMTKTLEEVKNNYRESGPSVVEILDKTKSSELSLMLEKFHEYSNAELLTSESRQHYKFLQTHLTTEDPEIVDLENKIRQKASGIIEVGYKTKILKSEMSFENKVVAYNKAEILESIGDSDASEHSKYKAWLDSLIAVPFGKYQGIGADNPSSTLRKVKEVLDEKLSFMERPKDQIINLVSRMLKNPASGINAIGLYGSKGTGKSSIVASIAEALERPFRMISLGGESDSSSLSGHGFTYIGSAPGRLIEILRESKTMNPVILVDELDKISQTTQGREIIGALIHLTDTTTNSRYNYDKYFSGIEFDLSKILFVFTYNDPNEIDKILADRLHQIKVENYTPKQKFEIAKRHLIKTVLKSLNFSESDIIFDDECINYIISKSIDDEGMRSIKTKLEIICSRINTLLMTLPEDEIVDLPYKNLYPSYRNIPVNVSTNHIDLFLKDSPAQAINNNSPPMGMYL
jgi:ATP-dependent Lon protease